jgi:hypothetical protein
MYITVFLPASFPSDRALQQPTAHNEAVGSPTTARSPQAERTPRDKSPPRPEDILLFPLPPQPSPRSSAFEVSGPGSHPGRLAVSIAFRYGFTPLMMSAASSFAERAET